MTAPKDTTGPEALRKKPAGKALPPKPGSAATQLGPTPAAAKPVSLALQGGGAHGAFTWGVLDYILRDGRLDVRAISATSAGAMNAVVMAEGLLEGGPDAARAQLERFWLAASVDGGFSAREQGLLHPFLSFWGAGHAAGNAFLELMSFAASPYALNPLDLNPLRDFLDKEINFAKIRKDSPIHLFIAATNVFTGQGRIFKSHELTSGHICASACLPEMFQAVEIEDVPYWDGGFAGNPALYPLFDVKETDDILLVQINPFNRHELPKTPGDIRDRKNEITFNASLLGELRAIRFVTRLLLDRKLSRDDYKQVLMHAISLHDEIQGLQAASKLDSSWAFLTSLRDAGARAAQKWLEAHFHAIGKTGTFDIDTLSAAADNSRAKTA
jgi:NTE family protein